MMPETPVQGATVFGDWRGLSTGTGHNGYTGSDGTAEIASPRVNYGLEGEFCFLVTGITKPNGWVYASDSQTLDSGCIHTDQL